MIDTPHDPRTREQVIELRLLDCGLSAEGLAVKYENYLQGIAVVIQPAAGATCEDFACIREAVFPDIVTFEDLSLFQQYMDFEAKLVRPQMLSDLEASLRTNGLLDNFPERSNYNGLADYARALETHASIEPGTALRVEGANQLTFNPTRGNQAYAEFAEQYSELLTVAMYASAKEQFSFGFIGNEKFAE